MIGDVKGMSYSRLGKTGVRQVGDDEWRWGTADRDFHVEIGNWFSTGSLTIFIKMPIARREKVGAAELRIGAIERPQPDYTLTDRRMGSREVGQFSIQLPRWKFSNLASSGQNLYVVGLDAAGNVIRSVRLDPTLLVRGEQAKRLAREGLVEKIRNFHQLCGPEYEGDQDIVIT